MRNLKTLRKARGLSQIVLAKKLKVVQSNISKWENGRAQANEANRKKVARVLRCELAELL
jgi:transcriptional regulator with XRE-family HTH domain